MGSWHIKRRDAEAGTDHFDGETTESCADWTRLTGRHSLLTVAVHD